MIYVFAVIGILTFLVGAGEGLLIIARQVKWAAARQLARLAYARAASVCKIRKGLEAPRVHMTPEQYERVYRDETPVRGRDLGAGGGHTLMGRGGPL